MTDSRIEMETAAGWRPLITVGEAASRAAGGRGAEFYAEIVKAGLAERNPDAVFRVVPADDEGRARAWEMLVEADMKGWAVRRKGLLDAYCALTGEDPKDVRRRMTASEAPNG